MNSSPTTHMSSTNLLSPLKTLSGLDPLSLPVNHKRKWDDILCDNEKQELEQHALILASLCSKPPETLTPNTPSCHYSPPSGSEDYDEMRVTAANHLKSDPKKRIRTTPEQLRVLEKTYERETNPSQSLREEIARKLGMTPRRVQVWFQNKRAKERRITKSMISESPSISGSQNRTDLSSERHLIGPIIESVPKIHTPTNSPNGSPARQNTSPSESSSSPPQHSLPLEPMNTYLPPPPQVQSFSVPEGIGRRRDSTGRLLLPFPGEGSRNPFPGSGNVPKEVREGDWKLPPLREIYNGI